MSTHVHIHLGRTKDAGTEHDPSSGRFTGSGKRNLSTGHTSHTSRYESGATNHTVSGNGLVYRHYIQHDPEGKVTSHMMEEPKKERSVKGFVMGSKRTMYTPEESEKKFKKLHHALRTEQQA